MKSGSLLLSIIVATILTGCNHKQNTTSPIEKTKSNFGAVLPFPEPPSASTYGESIFDSKHERRQNHRKYVPRQLGLGR